MENLLFEKDVKKVNIIDLKIGRSTVTKNCESDPEKLAKRHKKDASTTSLKSGYKITGFNLQDHATGQNLHKFVKKPYL